MTRERVISFRLSEEEHAQIEQVAARRGVPFSQAVREALLETSTEWRADAERLQRIEEKLDVLIKRKGK